MDIEENRLSYNDTVTIVADWKALKYLRSLVRRSAFFVDDDDMPHNNAIAIVTHTTNSDEECIKCTRPAVYCFGTDETGRYWYCGYCAAEVATILLAKHKWQRSKLEREMDNVTKSTSALKL